MASSWLLVHNEFTIDDILNLTENVLTDTAQFTEVSVEGFMYPVVDRFDPNGLTDYEDHRVRIRDHGGLFDSSFVVSDDANTNYLSFGDPNGNEPFSGYRDDLGPEPVDMMINSDDHGMSLTWKKGALTGDEVGDIYYAEFNFNQQDWDTEIDTGFNGALPSVWRDSDEGKTWLAYLLPLSGDWIKVADQLGAESIIESLVVYNGRLYGGTSDNGKLYRWNDIDTWEKVAGQLEAETHIYSLAVYNGRLYGGTGWHGKLYRWNDVDAWEEVADQLEGQNRILTLIVYNDRLYGGTGGFARLFRWNDIDAWEEVAGQAGGEDYILSLVVYNGRLYGGTGSNGKLYRWNDVDAWEEVAPKLWLESYIMSLVIYNNKLYGGTALNGKLYRWNDVDDWEEVAPTLGTETTIEFLVVYNGRLYGGTANHAYLYRWNDVGAWEEVAGPLGLGYRLASCVIYNYQLYVGAGFLGELYKWTDGVLGYSTQDSGATWECEFVVSSQDIQSAPYDEYIEGLKFCKQGSRLILLALVNDTSGGDDFAIFRIFSDDGGSTWSAPAAIDVVTFEAVDEHIRYQNFFDVKIDRFGNLVLAYTNKVDSNTKDGVLRVSYDGVKWYERTKPFILDSDWKMFDVGVFVDGQNYYWWTAKAADADIANTRQLFIANVTYDEAANWEVDQDTPDVSECFWNQGVDFTWDGADYSDSIMDNLCACWCRSRAFLMFTEGNYTTNYLCVIIGGDRSSLPQTEPWQHCWYSGTRKFPTDLEWTLHEVGGVGGGSVGMSGEYLRMTKVNAGNYYYKKDVDSTYIFANSKYEFGFRLPTAGYSAGVWIEWHYDDGVNDKEVLFRIDSGVAGNWKIDSPLGNTLASGSGFVWDIEWELMVHNKSNSCSFWRRPRGTETWEFLVTVVVQNGGTIAPESNIRMGIQIPGGGSGYAEFRFSADFIGGNTEDYIAWYNDPDVLPGTPVSVFGQQFLEKDLGDIRLRFAGYDSVDDDEWKLDYVLEATNYDRRNALRPRQTYTWESDPSIDQAIVLAHTPVERVSLNTLMLCNTNFRNFKLQAQNADGTDWSAPLYDHDFTMVSETGSIDEVRKTSITDTSKSWLEGELVGKILRVHDSTSLEFLYTIDWNYSDQIVLRGDDLITDGVLDTWNYEIIETLGIVEDLGDISYNYYRFVIPTQEISADDTLFRLGFLWLGQREVLMESPAYPWSSGFAVRMIRNRLRSGEELTKPTTTRKKLVFDLNFPIASEDLKVQIDSILRTLGGPATPFGLVWDQASDPFDLVLVRATNYPQIRRVIRQLRDVQLALEENL